MHKTVFLTQPANLSDELAEYRAHRLELISSDSNPIVLQQGAKVVLHLIPADAFNRSLDLDLRSLTKPLLPLFTGGSSRFNFDGKLTCSDSNGPVRSYVQLFPVVLLRLYTCSLPPMIGRYFQALLWGEIIEAIQSHLTAQQKLNVKLPIAVLLTFLDVRGYHLAVGDEHSKFTVTHSPFPYLYDAFQGKKEEFSEAAQLYSVLLLLLTHTVSNVLRLDIHLRSDETLDVIFEGARPPYYSNEEHYVIHVEGTCKLRN